MVLKFSHWLNENSSDKEEFLEDLRTGVIKTMSIFIARQFRVITEMGFNTQQEADHFVKTNYLPMHGYRNRKTDANYFYLAFGERQETLLEVMIDIPNMSCTVITLDSDVVLPNVRDSVRDSLIPRLFEKHFPTRVTSSKYGV